MERGECVCGGGGGGGGQLKGTGNWMDGTRGTLSSSRERCVTRGIADWAS